MMRVWKAESFSSGPGSEAGTLLDLDWTVGDRPRGLVVCLWHPMLVVVNTIPSNC